jgi:hypothetical protein
MMWAEGGYGGLADVAAGRGPAARGWRGAPSGSLSGFAHLLCQRIMYNARLPSQVTGGKIRTGRSIIIRDRRLHPI